MQISDSHIGFNKPANADVNATLQIAIDKINALPKAPDFLIHTGDLTHLAKPAEFDTLGQLLQGAKTKQVYYVPGEHDNATDDGKEYLARYGKGTKGTGWYSFDHHGVHFVGLVNSAALEGMGKLGAEQLAWLKDDLSGRSASTPIVLFAHIPLWTVYPDWGWGTSDSEEALGYVKRFGSVTVLNGHIHQTMQKVEGNVTIPHGDVDGVSATGARQRAVRRSDEGAGRETARRAGHPPGRVRGAVRSIWRLSIRRWSNPMLAKILCAALAGGAILLAFEQPGSSVARICSCGVAAAATLSTRTKKDRGCAASTAAKRRACPDFRLFRRVEESRTSAGMTPAWTAG